MTATLYHAQCYKMKGYWTHENISVDFLRSKIDAFKCIYSISMWYSEVFKITVKNYTKLHKTCILKAEKLKI